MKKKLVFFASLAIIVSFSLVVNPSTALEEETDQSSNLKCGYNSCPSTDSNKLNVHIIAHTHDDVGWLKTVDQYYYGTRKHDSPVGVQHILDSVIPQLVLDKSKRFIYVEISFFSKWWQEQDEQMRKTVRELVDEGRFEFINGGWCMNDEATVTYHSTIEQMTLGLKFLNETFGACGRPKVGWQIDPFGHSSEQASLFAQMGFDGMFFTRISYEDKKDRLANKTLDVIWHGDQALPGQAGSIFTNIFTDGYDAPSGFCFDAICLDDNLVDNKKSYEYNMEKKGLEFIGIIRNHSRVRMTNHILIPLGGDFQFSAAGQNFKNIDKLLKFIRNHPLAKDINIFYSTPSCYQKAIHETINRGGESLRLPNKYDDFMPYDSSPTVWWSGYFTSRPSVKLIERETANLLKVSRMMSLAQLTTSNVNQAGKSSDEVRDDFGSKLSEHEEQCLTPLWEVLGDLQHHDAVTGTEKQHVADDYVRRASDAQNMCAKFLAQTMRKRLFNGGEGSKIIDPKKSSYPVYDEHTAPILCPLLNISQCDAFNSDSKWAARRTPGKLLQVLGVVDKDGPSNSTNETTNAMQSVLMTVYNPFSQFIAEYIRLPCIGRCDKEKIRVIDVRSGSSEEVKVRPNIAGINQLPFRDAMTSFEFTFEAYLPPLGYSSYLIMDGNSEDASIGNSSKLEIEMKQLDKNLTYNPEATYQATLDKLSIHEKVLGSDKYNNETVEFYMEQFQSVELDYRLEKFRNKFNGSIKDLMLSGRRIMEIVEMSHSDSKIKVLFNRTTGMLTGIRRISDQFTVNINQRFGYYYPANSQAPPGAYIFRPNTSEPYMFEKPIESKIYGEEFSNYYEIHQKWADWIWQTIRIDKRKDYIDFDYVIGPVPIDSHVGRDVVSRFTVANMTTDGAFFTDSMSRQLMLRHRSRENLAEKPENTGGSFYPITSTIMMKNTALSDTYKTQVEAVAVLVDRSQAGTSLRDGELELMVHRRHTRDDHFGVGEALDEPGEDGRGLVVRGTHRLFLKLSQNNRTYGERTIIHGSSYSPRGQESFSFSHSPQKRSDDDPPKLVSMTVNDPLLDKLKLESIRFSHKPVMTFDKLSVSPERFMEIYSNITSDQYLASYSLLNNSLPKNVHLLTLLPWSSAQDESNLLLLRFEDLRNPLNLHAEPDYDAYKSIFKAYRMYSSFDINGMENDRCNVRYDGTINSFHIGNLFKNIQIVSVKEFNLGANKPIKYNQRLDWTGYRSSVNGCRDHQDTSSLFIDLGPREIRTYLAKFEYLS